MRMITKSNDNGRKALPLLQQVLRHLNTLRAASDGDDAVAGARQRLGDLDAGAALLPDLADPGTGLADYRARQLQNINSYSNWSSLLLLTNRTNRMTVEGFVYWEHGGKIQVSISGLTEVAAPCL